MIIKKETLQEIYTLMGYVAQPNCCATCHYSREEEPDDDDKDENETMTCKINSFEIFVNRNGVCRYYEKKIIKEKSRKKEPPQLGSLGVIKKNDI